MLNFSLKEVNKAWNENFRASDVSPRKNAHRLLLFYAVETGLKAFYMKKNGINQTKDLEGKKGQKTNERILTHNLETLLKELGASSTLYLPNNIKMSNNRSLNCSEINEMWRYGGKSNDPTDQEIEQKLEKINQWLKQELTRL